MAADHCIVAFANHRGNYRKGLTRLRNSLKIQGFDGRFIGFMGESTVGAPPHMSFPPSPADNPYAFKIYAIKKALSEGCRKILYVDCSVWAVRNVTPAFNIIESQGYAMQESGHYLKNWINDDALKYFGIRRDALDGVVMYGNAGFLGLNFDDPTATEFFRKWEQAMLAGAFRGSWADHRHDMACGSMIAWLMHMDKKFIKGDQILEYAHWDAPIKNESIIFKAAGL